MKQAAIFSLLLLATSGCEGGIGLGLDLPGGATPDTSLGTATEVADQSGFADDGGPARSAELSGDDLDSLVFPELPNDGNATGCAPGEGCFLDPCTANEDCLSGWCVGHMGDSVCTVACQTECAAGWSCRQVAGTDPDVVFICVSDFATLCRPCENGSNCEGLAGEEDVCVDYGVEGSFCGGICQGDTDCPWGFSCSDVVTVDAVPVKQCVADAGVCPCTSKSVELGLWTPCELANQWGLCQGKRVCAQGGLSTCDAMVPAPEVCNGLDDDCDGDVDEETCTDDNQCTDDVCLGEQGCEHLPLEQGECMDGDPCSVADHCEAGICVGQQVNCDDQNPCTDDFCDIAGGCLHEFNTDKCDDGDPCTVADQCEQGTCSGVTVNCDCQSDSNCAALEDGNLCNGTLFCDTDTLPYTCEVDAATVVDCPEPQGGDAPCLMAACNPETGGCSLATANEGFPCDDGDPCTVADKCVQGACSGGLAANCNDGNPCTDDSCLPGAGCQYEFNDLPCEDGDTCTVSDKCSMGVCQGGPDGSCHDGNPCTDDSCVSGQGCFFLFNDAPCDDDNICTIGDHCAQGKCAAAGMADCDDDNLCTNDLCKPSLGCTHQFNAFPCDDADACTTGDLCNVGLCAGSPVSCNDGNTCTDDSCDPVQGCQYVANDGPCDDNNLCSKDDQCKNGICVPGNGVYCADDNPCTDDLCEPAVGCVHNSNAAQCNDGNPCTVGDKCELGLCVSQETLDCADDNICTDDSCQEGVGCVNSPNVLPCDDLNACTEGDTCAAGACLPGPAVDCTDWNVCTDEYCEPALGCVYSFNNNPCDDGDACSTGDNCVLGVCNGGPELQCDDGDLCTQNSCSEDTGCVYTPIEPCCGNGAVEQGEECDDGNNIGGDGCEADCTVPDLYWKSGPQTNVNQNQLAGWVACYNDKYSHAGTGLNTILNQCNKTKLLMACRQVGSQTFKVLAMAQRSDVSFNTGTGNTTHDANGVAWYFDHQDSWGFAVPGTGVSRSSCDTASSQGDKRLCWHTGGGSIDDGWRCGTTTDLNGNSSWERYVFHAN